MKENRLIVRIQKPVSEVFDFTITPSNTPAWIDSIIEEKINGSEIKVGTQYTNIDRGGVTNLYQVTKFESDRVFELRSVTSTYHVRYTYIAISPEETELEYFEWVDNGVLDNPFEQGTLEKLKVVLENS
jgi:hypothetical protein